MKYWFIAFFAVVMLVNTNALYAKNPIISYFSHLLDETKAELAIGNFIKTNFLKELSGHIKVYKDKILTEKMQKLALTSQRPEIHCEVYVIKSEIPDVIPLPGGTVFITEGLIKAAENTQSLQFILASSLMNIVLRQPMKVIKKEGLYARFLNMLKLSEQKIKPEKVKNLIRDYIRSLPSMNQKKADIQGILLTKSPENSRKKAVKLLESFSCSVWPVFPWDRGDLNERIKNLKLTKFPE